MVVLTPSSDARLFKNRHNRFKKPKKPVQAETDAVVERTDTVVHNTTGNFTGQVNTTEQNTTEQNTTEQNTTELNTTELNITEQNTTSTSLTNESLNDSTETHNSSNSSVKNNSPATNFSDNFSEPQTPMLNLSNFFSSNDLQAHIDKWLKIILLDNSRSFRQDIQDRVNNEVFFLNIKSKDYVANLYENYYNQWQVSSLDTVNVDNYVRKFNQSFTQELTKMSEQVKSDFIFRLEESEKTNGGFPDTMYMRKIFIRELASFLDQNTIGLYMKISETIFEEFNLDLAFAHTQESIKQKINVEPDVDPKFLN